MTKNSAVKLFWGFVILITSGCVPLTSSPILESLNLAPKSKIAICEMVWDHQNSEYKIDKFAIDFKSEKYILVDPDPVRGTYKVKNWYDENFFKEIADKMDVDMFFGIKTFYNEFWFNGEYNKYATEQKGLVLLNKMYYVELKNKNGEEIAHRFFTNIEWPRRVLPIYENTKIHQILFDDKLPKDQILYYDSTEDLKKWFKENI